MAARCSCLCDLPREVLSDILSAFCDGKSISTFSIVAQGNASLRELRFVVLRDALVARYCRLSERFQEDEEIRDTLHVIREDIRTCEEFSYEATTSFPKWCAIVDYFEGNGRHVGGWVVWSGPIETQIGPVMEHALLETKRWSAGALQYWYNDFELHQYALVPPVHGPPLPSENLYGFLVALTLEDVEVMDRVQNTLDPPGMGRYALVPRHLDFDSDPSICFTLTADYEGARLVCYWDHNQDQYDWEEAIDRLGENAIRVMKRFKAAQARSANYLLSEAF